VAGRGPSPGCCCHSSSDSGFRHAGSSTELWQRLHSSSAAVATCKHRQREDAGNSTGTGTGTAAGPLHRCHQLGHVGSGPGPSADPGSRYRCTFVLCLIGRPKAHNFWHGPYLARPNLIVGLGRHGPHCGPCLGLKSSPRAGLTRPI
jgi:hypothetical protein